MIKTIAKLLSMHFKSMLIKILRANFFKNPSKQILRTKLKKTKILSMAKPKI